MVVKTRHAIRNVNRDDNNNSSCKFRTFQDASLAVECSNCSIDNELRSVVLITIGMLLRAIDPQTQQIELLYETYKLGNNKLKQGKIQVSFLNRCIKQ